MRVFFFMKACPTLKFRSKIKEVFKTNAEQLPIIKNLWRSPSWNHITPNRLVRITAIYRISWIPIYKNRWLIGEFYSQALSKRHMRPRRMLTWKYKRTPIDLWAHLRVLLKAGPPWFEFLVIFDFLHHSIERVEGYLVWKLHKKIQRKSWSNVLPNLLTCIGFLYKAVHGSIPGWGVCDFFHFCQSFTSNSPFTFSFPFLLSFPLPFPSSSFPLLFLSLSLRPFVCTKKMHLRIYPINYSFSPCVMHNGDRDGSPERSELVKCGHWMMPMLWSGGRADKISNKLAGDVACLGGSMVEHQPRLLGVPCSIPGWGVCDFFSVSAKASLPILLSLSPFPFPLPPTSRLH